MIALLKKELSSFLNSLIGYVVIVVFLLMMGLFLWVFPGEPNILMNQYAGIDGLFSITPYLYIFLVPAITMKSFSEEKKSGTIEFLLTKPLSEFQIILAKYLAGFVLLLIALIPSFVYYYSVYKQGNPVGNIDIGSTNGSYIGLVMLGSAFVSVGIFASILSDSQIISFLIGVFLSFFFLSGIESIASIPLFNSIDWILLEFSLNSHYLSMSRGVIDSRDIIFFISFNAIFILLTQLKLESRKW